MKKDKVLTSVKDEQLIKKRRDQMIQGAIKLFKEKGFHRTTTREIAKASGFSIGTLYEYIRKKEDVLFLVCDSIYEKVKEKMEPAMHLESSVSIEEFKDILRSYYYLMDGMQEEILILYQEVKGLSGETRNYVLQKEKDIVQMLKSVIMTCLPQQFTESEVHLIANNIIVQGQMWGFRRWNIQTDYTIEEYAELQINYNLAAMKL